MNALAEAARMLGDMELSPSQLAQLRALNRKYAQRLYERRGSEAELRALLRSDILAMLTPEQERAFRRVSP
jgi:Spy/CpxP family protein refolding chaperone